MQNQEAKAVRQLGSLIFDTPLQHDYESGVEVRTLLPTEKVDEVNGRSAVIDVGVDGGPGGYVKFWTDAIPDSPLEVHDVQQRLSGMPMFGDWSTQSADVSQQQCRREGLTLGQEDVQRISHLAHTTPAAANPVCAGEGLLSLRMHTANNQEERGYELREFQ